MLGITNYTQANFNRDNKYFSRYKDKWVLHHLASCRETNSYAFKEWASQLPAQDVKIYGLLRNFGPSYRNPIENKSKRTKTLLDQFSRFYSHIIYTLTEMRLCPPLLAQQHEFNLEAHKFGWEVEPVYKWAWVTSHTKRLRTGTWYGEIQVPSQFLKYKPITSYLTLLPRLVNTGIRYGSSAQMRYFHKNYNFHCTNWFSKLASTTYLNYFGKKNFWGFTEWLMHDPKLLLDRIEEAQNKSKIDGVESFMGWAKEKGKIPSTCLDWMRLLSDDHPFNLLSY
jgi:hypothetical protein